MNDEHTSTIIEPDVMPDQAIERRHPSVPVTLNELAALKGQADEITEARVRVLETLRKASIRMTSPEDWLLFRAKDGRVVGFLADSGCERVRKLYGIEIFDVGEPTKVNGERAGEFFYFIRGSGRCNLTGEEIVQVEGGRSSDDDFCKGKEGIQLEFSVRKAARANLDGGIVRELAGLSSVPDGELSAAWAGTSKSVNHCRKGRGFGSGAERQGAQVQEAAHVVAGKEPTCKQCGMKMRFVKAGKTKDGREYAAFWACEDRDHKKDNIKDSDWQDKLRAENAGHEPGDEAGQ